MEPRLGRAEIYTNTAVTRYKKTVTDHVESYERIVIAAVFWDRKAKSRVTEHGMVRADNVTVFIPFSEAGEPPAIGDVLVKGTVTKEITSSYTIKDLVNEYPENMVVKSVDPRDFGSQALHHWQVEGS